MIKKNDVNQLLREGYLKQPNDLVAMRHPFDVIQGRVVSAILEKLQDFISVHCEQEDIDHVLEKFHDPSFPELSKNNLVLTINYQDVGVHSKNYDVLRESLMKMAKIPVDIIRRDKEGTPWETFTQFCTPMLPMEEDENGKMVESKYKRYFKVVLTKEVLNFLLDTKKGWSLYLRRVVMATKNKYAFRFYLLISQWQNDGVHEFSVAYIREWLKMGTKCARWNDFLARVIRPAEKELHELFDKGVCDLFFETELIYPEGKKRGQPDKLLFRIYSKDSLPVSNASEIKPDEQLDQMLMKDFAQNAANRKDILSLVTESNRDDFLNYCKEILPQICKKKKGEIKQMSSYCYISLVKFLRDWKPQSSSAPSEGMLDRHAAKVAAKTYVRDESEAKWQKVLAVCRERWTDGQVAEWLAPLQYRGRKDGAVCVKMPNAIFGKDMYAHGAYQQLLAVCRELWPDENFCLES